MTTVKIGGVPEHFNLPWYTTLKSGAYKNEGINLRWTDYHGGTGQMCKALRNGEIDIAVVLTEGIIKDITEGNPSKIIQVYIKTPLIWGIHVAANSEFNSINDLKGRKAAISRFGSGSHLMSYINAERHNWNIKKDLNFEIIKNLDGAVEGLTSGKADYFLWEKFTTKPIVDKGVFRHLGNCPTPWPCFVIAVRDEFIENKKELLQTILNIINIETLTFKSLNDIDLMVSKRYKQKINDVREWLSLTEWSQSNIDKNTILNTQNSLFKLNIIKEKIDYSSLVFTDI